MAAAVSTRYLESLLFAVSSRAPWAFMVPAIALAAAAVLAAWIAAARQGRLPPAEVWIPLRRPRRARGWDGVSGRGGRARVSPHSATGCMPFIVDGRETSQAQVATLAPEKMSPVIVLMRGEAMRLLGSIGQRAAVF
ncbi:MAG: hypothetical protein HN396_10425 [Gemmatimonadales bacterium]|nr:hypothetical protein [Gemmatimonadales bacterium]MDG2239454.1 hypothetical protein [Longimicrobiales bacterium]MBT3498231.1 hypothetical protein [Gemmatimonadales bacterium]MBT3773286.1 hypothetical protein [Gemmatimonadales bacterium]MBT3957492.1 hypothetical protein [Gemmatimonadales bacterium]